MHARAQAHAPFRVAVLDVNIVDKCDDDGGGELNVVVYEEGDAHNGNRRENILPRQPVGAVPEYWTLGDAAADDGEGDTDGETDVPAAAALKEKSVSDFRGGGTYHVVPRPG